MSDSILDKVLSRKEDQEKQEFNPLEVLNTLLKTLASKEADVLRRRYGLTEAGKETLETIGAFYNVTRERIRQIENLGVEKMKASGIFVDVMRPVEHLVVTLLNHHGGVMTQDALLESLLGVHIEQPQYRQAVGFILSELMNDKLTEIPKSKKYVAGWKLQLTSMDFVDTAIAELEQVIRAAGKPQSFSDVLDAFQKTAFYQQNDQKLTEDAVLSYVDLSAQLARNPFDEYGLTEWGLVLPKRMNDRVYLVLKKEGHPMHFEEIAKRISKIFKKRAYPPTVHNELILNSEYVLVGRGIYALKEWGYKEGVVSDVLVDILQRAGHPMQRNELVDAVLKQRMVKKNTILLALADKQFFQKTKDGKFMLVKTPKPEEAPPQTPVPPTTPQQTE